MIRYSLLPPSPSSKNKFRYQKVWEAQKGPLTKFLDTVRQQTLSQVIFLSPLLGMKIFEIRNFLKHGRVPLQKDSALWDKTIWTEKRYRPTPLFFIKIFTTVKFLKHSTERYLQIIFRQSETKNVLQKKLIAFTPNIFRYQKLVAHWRVPLRNFSAARQIFLKENFDTTSFPSPLSCTWKLSIPENLWNREVFPYGVFDTVIQKTFDWKPWHNPLSKTFPHIRNYWSTKRFLQEFFSALWAKNFLKDIVILSLHLPPPASPSLVHKNFRYQKLRET